MKILFLVPYPLNQSPSQRFRFEQYFSSLKANGHSYEVRSFLANSGWKIIYKEGHLLQKLWSIVRGYFVRLVHVLQASHYDVIFIHREAAPLGPPVFEWLLAKVLRKRIIYDFDDAIWTTDTNNESSLVRILKWRKKVADVCKWSYKVSVGNNYLADYARQFNRNTIVNPTTIDTENVHKSSKKSERPDSDIVTIGWTGSHSTLKYICEIEEALTKITSEFNVRFLVIANVSPRLNISNLEFVSWNLATEIDDLAKIDIGIMPLPNDEWSKGKCGFKALQYMSLGIPTIASPVGVNSDIITDGVNGLLASSNQEWYNALKKLVTDRRIRQALGNNGRTTVESRYSVNANTNNFLSLFTSDGGNGSPQSLRKNLISNGHYQS